MTYYKHRLLFPSSNREEFVYLPVGQENVTNMNSPFWNAIFSVTGESDINALRELGYKLLYVGTEEKNLSKFYRYTIVYPDGKRENIDAPENHKSDYVSQKFQELTGKEFGGYLKEEGFKLLCIGAVEKDIERNQSSKST